jgi:UDP-3-O-[3-hydroxymyristoyl] glucosamine N-acyltransferase
MKSGPTAITVTVAVKASSLAEEISGSVLGDPLLSISAVTALEKPMPNSLTFVRTTSQSHLAQAIQGCTAQAILVPRELASPEMVPSESALILVDDPYRAFLNLLPVFYPPHEHPRAIHPSATIDPSAQIGSNVAIGAHCSIGPDVVVGDNAILHPGVHLYRAAQVGKNVTLHCGVSVREECVIGENSTIHNNSVIGADGFGYIPDPKVGLRKVPQVGIVTIGKNVEIGANTCIDRGAFGSTTIGDNTKIDNLVQIGHNATIGKFCIICGQVGIAGSTTIGDNVVLAGGSGIADHLSICSNARVGGRSGVTRDITTPGDYLGFPAERATTWRRMQVAIRRLSAGRKAKS